MFKRKGENIVINKCSCGSKHFEDVDVTPVGASNRRYFTRCKQCGLVIAVFGDDQKETYYDCLANSLSEIGKKLKTYICKSF
ncbi:MAG: hypothetical protein H6Q70_1392 [Firmicutes bacterium]|nr:hypothetical protein [Bacillota bacterium]